MNCKWDDLIYLSVKDAVNAVEQQEEQCDSVQIN